VARCQHEGHRRVENRPEPFIAPAHPPLNLAHQNPSTGQQSRLLQRFSRPQIFGREPRRRIFSRTSIKTSPGGDMVSQKAALRTIWPPHSTTHTDPTSVSRSAAAANSASVAARNRPSAGVGKQNFLGLNIVCAVVQQQPPRILVCAAISVALLTHSNSRNIGSACSLAQASRRTRSIARDRTYCKSAMTGRSPIQQHDVGIDKPAPQRGVRPI
jgi:hypothetical protein